MDCRAGPMARMTALRRPTISAEDPLPLGEVSTTETEEEEEAVVDTVIEVEAEATADEEVMADEATLADGNGIQDMGPEDVIWDMGTVVARDAQEAGVEVHLGGMAFAKNHRLHLPVAGRPLRPSVVGALLPLQGTDHPVGDHLRPADETDQSRLHYVQRIVVRAQTLWINLLLPLDDASTVVPVVDLDPEHLHPLIQAIEPDRAPALALRLSLHLAAEDGRPLPLHVEMHETTHPRSERAGATPLPGVEISVLRPEGEMTTPLLVDVRTAHHLDVAVPVQVAHRLRKDAVPFPLLHHQRRSSRRGGASLLKKTSRERSWTGLWQRANGRTESVINEYAYSCRLADFPAGRLQPQMTCGVVERDKSACIWVLTVNRLEGVL